MQGTHTHAKPGAGKASGMGVMRLQGRNGRFAGRVRAGSLSLGAALAFPSAMGAALAFVSAVLDEMVHFLCWSRQPHAGRRRREV